MNKQIQEKLIIITFLIAVFLLGNFVWEKLPKYEIQERITKGEGSKMCLGSGLDSEYNCSPSYWFDVLPDSENRKEIYKLCKEFEGEDLENFSDFYKICYIKEKVRVK